MLFFSFAEQTNSKASKGMLRLAPIATLAIHLVLPTLGC